MKIIHILKEGLSKDNMVSEELVQKDFLRYTRTVGMTTMRGRGFYYPVDSTMSSDGRIYVVSRSSENAPSDTRRVTVLNVDGEYFGVFGTGVSGEDGAFKWPCGIAADSQNRIYVTDEHLHTVFIYKDSGEYLGRWGARGTAEGQLNGPSGIAFDQDGNVLISDSLNHRIQKFSNDGEFILSFGSQGSGDGELNLPWGLGTNSESEVFVADWGTQVLQVFDRDGNFLDLKRGAAALTAWAIEYLEAQQDEKIARSTYVPVYDTDTDDVREISARIEPFFWDPCSVTLDENGRVYVLETCRHRFQIFERI